VSVLEGDFTPNDPRIEDVRHIGESAHRAAALTRQLLAFSRHHRHAPQQVDLNTLLRRQEQMLARVIGENVRISLRLSDQSSPVRVDPAQIEQVILNLAINARDAMPDGGTFQLETSPHEAQTGSVVEWDGLQPGAYVALIVSDTGHGMTPEVQTRAFEPFFTTKDVGRGTGLGLSTVYGIVSQSGGHIRVSSKPGVGTTFTILLPRVETAAAAVPDSGASLRAIPRGSETILLVEDEAPLRALAAAVLRRRGYWVLEASNGLDALALASRESGPLHLLVTDVVMPGMTGAGLASRLVQTRPEARVLYMSGYTDNPEALGLGFGSDFISKPFTPDELLDRVRALLDRPARQGADPL
jgi:two-component system cell cycle sensor histidine kinase/response regulator CckA